MLSLNATNNAAYCRDLATERYFHAGGEPPGQYWGKGARALRLIGKVDPDSFTRVFEGFRPFDDGVLVQNAGRADRQCAWDLTFSAPKSVSVFWARLDETARRAIQNAHLAAVTRALDYLQDEHSWTRRGKDGRTVERAGLVVAIYEHATSRAGDPQLHSHCIVMNAALRADGSFGSLQSKPFYLAKMAAGALYRAELARCLLTLGYPIERSGSTFEVAGVPAELIQEFSKRRAEIEKALAERGQWSARAAAFAALDTRSAKAHVPREQLLLEWAQVADRSGFTLEAARELRQTPSQRDLRAETGEAVRRATGRLSGEVSHFCGRDLVRYVAEEATGRGLGAEHVRVAVEHEIRHGEVVHLGDARGEARYATPEIMALERQLLADVDWMRAAASQRLSDREVDQAVRQAGDGETRKARLKDPGAEARRLNDEQLRGLRHTTQGDGLVSVVAGMAGTGKSFMMSAVREAWEQAGYRVLGAALSAKAGRSLEAGSGIQSFTVHKLLSEWERGFHYQPDLKSKILAEVKHATWQIDGTTRKKVLGKYHQPTSRLAHELKYMTWQISKRHRDFLNLRLERDRLRLDEKTVLVVDEAGMIGTALMAKLVAACRAAHSRLLVVGDSRQLQAIEVGGPFQHIQARIGSAELTQIVRQEIDRSDTTNPYWRRDAVRAFADGRAVDALAEFERRGLLHVAETREGAVEALVERWARQGTARPADHLILTSRRDEARSLNAQAQTARRAAGKLGSRHVRIGDEVFFEKDRVLLTRNDSRLQVRNGDLGTIRELDLVNRRMRIRLDDGREVSLPYATFPHLSLGYALTTHKAQGATVKQAYVLCGGTMLDSHLSYVQASRARQDTRFFTHRLLEWDPQAGKRVDTTLETLGRQMSKSRQKDLAHDVLGRPSRELQETGPVHAL